MHTAELNLSHRDNNEAYWCFKHLSMHTAKRNLKKTVYAQITEKKC